MTDICKVEKYDLSSVSAIICAAAPLSKEIQSQLFARTKVDRSPKMLLETEIILDLFLVCT